MLYIRQISARRAGFLSTVAVIATLVGGAAHAQSLRDAQPPSEFPPESYSANQYVDSRGCVFVRAGIGGATEWVPRVTREREQLCGFQPSLQIAQTTPTRPQPRNVPNPLDTPVAGLADREPATIAPEPAIVAQEPEVAEVAEAVEAATGPVIISARVTAAAETSAPAPAAVSTSAAAPAPVAATAPVQDPVFTPANAPVPATAPVASARPSPRVITEPVIEPVPAPVVLTRAQACEGLTGVQPHIVSSRTGEPIDCGGAEPVVLAAATPAPVAQPVDQRPRLNRAQACADIAATGRQYVSTTTGLPIRCDVPSAQSTNPWERLQADLQAPARPYSNPLEAAPGSLVPPTQRPRVASTSPRAYSNPLDRAPGSVGVFTPGMNTQLAENCTYSGRWSVSSAMVAQCGPQVSATNGVAPAEVVTRARTSPSQQPVIGIFNQRPVPYSNPTTSYALPAPVVPDGYDRVWGDGRLNTQRGLPVTAPTANSTVRYATAPVAAAPQATVSTRVAPRVEQISGHRYVQVGTYSSRDQAQSIAQALRARGLPMRVGVYNDQGQQLRIVLAGPFANDRQLQNALGTAHGAGFGGAFTRR